MRNINYQDLSNEHSIESGSMLRDRPGELFPSSKEFDLEEESSRDLAELMGDNNDSVRNILETDPMDTVNEDRSSLNDIDRKAGLKQQDIPLPLKNILIYAPGERVRILVGAHIIVEADLKVPLHVTDEERDTLPDYQIRICRKFCRVLHLHAAAKYEKPGEVLVVIRNVNIISDFTDKDVPYFTPGVEDGKDTLGDKRHAFLYFWGLNLTRKIDDLHLCHQEG